LFPDPAWWNGWASIGGLRRAGRRARTMLTVLISVGVKLMAGMRTRHRAPWMSWWSAFWDGPHMHCDSPIRFNHSCPDLGKNDFTIWTYEIIVSFCNMRPDNLDMKKGLPNQILHSL
jgi:hypothetical protein